MADVEPRPAEWATEARPGLVESEAGRIDLDAEGRILAIDDRARAALGLAAEAPAAEFEAVLARRGLLPDTVRAGIREQADLLVACCPHADGGYSLLLRRRAGDAASPGDDEPVSFPRFNDDEHRLVLTNVSHELSTPLTTLKSSLSLLEKTAHELPESRRALVVAGRRSVDRLIGVVGKLGDTLSVLAGGLQLQPGQHDPAVLLAEAVRQANRLTDHEDLTFHEPESSPGHVSVDRRSVLRALVELLENAVKFSPSGSEVEAELRADEAELAFVISDRGEGLTRADLERLSEPFRQADMTMTRSAGGLGLGLGVCKAVAEAHGGRLEARARTGGGTEFHLIIPTDS
ncbi:MAG: ATP-binding protein [Acidobacteriota bacterium]